MKFSINEKLLISVTVITILLFMILFLKSAIAAPILPEMYQDQCISCHNSIVIHHDDDIEDCNTCHTLVDNDYEYCDNCHLDYDHHEDASGTCGTCHEDKQYQKKINKNLKPYI